ncbi:MAG: hypothetical protein SGILL_007228, partial [Bacillariaceae sp.]
MMERLALFIDEYEDVRFQNLLSRLEHDASVTRRQDQATTLPNIRRHFSTVRHVQVYQWHRHQLPLPFYQAHWDPPHRRTAADKQAFYQSLARGIPHLENLSLRNCSREDLQICAESMEPQEEHRPFSELKSIFVVLAERESMEERFLRALAQLPSLTSVSLCLDELNDNCNFSVLLQSTTLNSLDIQRERVMRRQSADETLVKRTICVPKQIMPICQALKETNQTVRSVDIEHDMSQEGVCLMLEMLETNKYMRSLTISFEIPRPETSEGTNDGCCIVSALCNALRVNQTLQHFQNRKANLFKASDKAHDKILSLLDDSNYTLRVLDICSEEGDDDDVRRFASKK